MALTQLPAWVEVLAAINDRRGGSITQIAKETGITYSYANRVIHELAGRGIIQLTTSGRDTRLLLTKKGEDIGRLCSELGSAMARMKK